MPLSNAVLEAMIGTLVKETDSLRDRLAKLESSSNLPTNSSVSPSTAPTTGRASSSKGQMPVPPSTPIHSPPSITPLPTNISTLLSKAVLEKTVITILIPDQQTGHVIGRAGTGLRQIHDISHAKISVAPPSGNTGFRSVTIRGTAREVGDAVSAIGKRLAHRRVRVPHAKKKPSPPVQSQLSHSPPSFLAPPPLSHTPLPSSPITPPLSSPVPKSVPKLSVTPPTPSPASTSSPMVVDTPAPPSPSGSPMRIDLATMSVEDLHAFGKANPFALEILVNNNPSLPSHVQEVAGQLQQQRQNQSSKPKSKKKRK